ncbi:MAG: RpoL/Rpb11 RNA polymerase subunit family protein [archaeon]
MEIKIIKSSKDEIQVELENITIAEILRVYLNKDSGVSFTAWKREHPTKKPLLVVKTSGKTAKKAVNDAVNSIIKDLDNFEKDFSKLK